MKKHLKFNKKHNNIIKSKIFLKILPFLIAGATLGGCKEKIEYDEYMFEINDFYTDATPEGSSVGERPSGANNISQFNYEGIRYQRDPDLDVWEASYEMYQNLNKYEQGKEANISDRSNANRKYAIVLLYNYNNSKSQQLADSLKQKTK